MVVCRFLNTCVLVFVWNLNMPIWLCNHKMYNVSLLSNIYFSFQCLVIIHMRAQFKDNCVGTCAYVGCMCNVDIFIIFRKPLKRVWCTCSVCGLLHFSYMYVCIDGGSEQDVSQLFVASLSNLEQQIHIRLSFLVLK